MTNDGTFECILIGPDGQVVRGEQPLVDGVPPMELKFASKEGPFDLMGHYRRTEHKIEGRIRFDWVESVHPNNLTIYRLASTDGLGPHGLVNDPD